MRPSLSAFLLLRVVAPAHSACDPSAKAPDLASAAASDSGCAYPACAPSAGADPSRWRCVHDFSFCRPGEITVTAADALARGRACRCTDILGFPSLVGQCDHGGGTLTAMVLPEDCGGGTPVCGATSNAGGNTFEVGDPDRAVFTACDLACAHGHGHAVHVPEDTYRGCAVPSFEWAVASTSVGGSMAGNNIVAATVGGRSTLVVAGEIYSNGEAEDPAVVFRGPFTAADPTGAQATEVSHTVPYEDMRRPWDAAFFWIDAATGEPNRVVSVAGYGTAYVHGFGIGGPDGDFLAAGGEHSPGPGMQAKTEVCTPISYNDGGGTVCEGEKTLLESHGIGWPGFVVALSANSGNIKWMVQPWLQLNEEEVAANRTLEEHSVVGVTVGADGDVFLTGFKALGLKSGATVIPNLSGWSQPDVVYTAIVSRLSADDGREIWRKEYPELKHAIKSTLDEDTAALYFTAEMTGEDTDSAGELGVSCDTSPGGCSLLVAVSTVDGSLLWVRYAHGMYDRPWESGEVHLAAPSDGPYVYAAFQDAGVHGPTTLDAGSPYAGCRDNTTGAVIPEYSAVFDPAVTVDQAACDAAGAGTYIGRGSEYAVPAAAGGTGARCGASPATSCLAKFHRTSGKPVWGSAVPRVHSFVPHDAGVTLVGSAFGPADFDAVTAAGPVGWVEGYDMVWLAEVTTEGRGTYVQTVASDRSYAAGCALAADAAGDLFAAFYTTSSVTRLGPGPPGGWEMDLGLDICGPDEVPCEGDTRLTVVRLGAEATPSCVETCGDAGQDTIVAPDTCYIDGVCYDAGGTGAFLGAPCWACDPAASQREWTEAGVGTDFCFLEGVCHPAGGPRPIPVGRWGSVDSECEVCSPGDDARGWTVTDGFVLADDGANCTAAATDLGGGTGEAEQSAGSEDAGINVGSIVGIVVGVFVVAAVLVIVAVGRAKKEKNAESSGAVKDQTEQIM